MNQEQFEKDLKNKFQNYSPQLDESALWSDIDNELGEEPKRQRILFWFLLPAIVIGTLVIPFLINSYKTIDQSVITFDKKIITESERPNKIDAEIPSTEKQVDDFNKLAEKLNQETRNIDLKNSTKLQSIAKGKALQNNIETTSRTQKNQTVGSNNLQIQKKVSSEKQLGLIEPEIKEDKLKVELTSKSAPLNVSIQEISKLTFNLIDKREDIEIHLKTSAPIYKEEQALNKWNLDWGVGGGFVKSNFESNSTDDEVKNLRQSLEKDEMSYSFNTSIGYKLNSNWSISLGLSYIEMITSGHVKNVNVNNISIMDTVALYHSFNSTTAEIGQREFIETKTQMHNRYNRFQQLHMPISIRYSNSINENWGYGLSVGYSANIWNKTSGYEQDLQDKAYNLSEDVNERLNKSGRNRLITSAHITKSFLDNAHLYLGLQYMHDTKGIYNDDYLIQKKMNVFQINGGVQIPLNFKK